MGKQLAPSDAAFSPGKQRAPVASMAAIRRYARQVGQRFEPNKIILFGSRAYGKPDRDSDVDLMVVMPTANHVTQAIRIRLALPAPFPMDLLVRTPDDLRRGFEEDNWFLREVIEKGKVLYEAQDGPVGVKSRIGPRGRPKNRQRRTSAS